MLAGSAADEVINGASQQLRTGTAVVDAQQGAALTLLVAGDSLAIPSGSATEADRGVTVRIGALAGPASIASANGRQATLPALAQTVLDGDALPGTATPLHLSDSADEARAVPTLVSDDLALKTLAAGIDATGASTASTVEASWTGTIAAAPTGATLGDQVLPVVIADATKSAGGDPQTRYDHVVAWRAAGGSWGVVVHLLAGRASDVVRTLSTLQQSEPTGQVGTVSTQALVGTVGPGIPGVTGPAKPPVHPTTPPSRQPTGPGGNAPTPTPTSADGVVGGLLDTVGSVLSGVVGLLSTPQTSPAQTHKPSTTATASPKKTTSPGLLGGLLGGLGLGSSR
jgi:hypothetical protein